MKRFAIVLLVLLSLTVYAALPTMVTAKLYVYECTETGAAFPADPPDTTAEVTYVSSLNPNPIRYSPKGVYSAVDGSITWYVPINSYLKVGCSAVIGMSTPANFAIATDNVVLNDMISSTPPSVTSVNSFVTMDCPSGTDPVADSALDTLTWTAGTGISITGNSTSDSITIANTATLENVTANGGTTAADITMQVGAATLYEPNDTGGSMFPLSYSIDCVRDTGGPEGDLKYLNIDPVAATVPPHQIGRYGMYSGSFYAHRTTEWPGKIGILKSDTIAGESLFLADPFAVSGTAYTFNTNANLATGARLFDFKENSVSVLYVNGNGDGVASGSWTFAGSVSADSGTFDHGVTIGNSDGDGGALSFHSMPFVTDYVVTLAANVSTTNNAAFYLPADEPAGESFLKMGTDGVMDYDASTYLTAEVDGSVSNEGSLSVWPGSATTSTIVSNTSGSKAVTIEASTGLSIAEAGSTITLTNSAPDQTVAFTNGGITAVTGTYPNFTITSTEADTLASVTTRGATTDQLITLDNGNTSAGRILFLEDSSNGSNGVTLSGAQSTDDVTVTLPSATGTIPLLESANTWTAAHTFSKAVTDGTSVLALTGAWDVDTADEPHVRIGAESATWSTSGTGLGLNAPNGFAGNLIDAQVNGTSKFKIDSAGAVTATSGAVSGALIVGSTSKFTSGLYAGTGGSDAKRLALNFGATTDPLTGYINWEGSSADDYETTLAVVNATNDNTLLLPDESGTLVTQAYGEMYAYENTTALAIGTVDIYHAVGSSGLVTGLVNGFTFQAGSTGPISAFADYSGTVAGTVLVTDTAHGLLTGDIVTIDGTTNYNGTFSITKVDDNTFYITDTWVADDATGNWTMGAYLKASKAGVYRVGMSLTAHSASANKTFKFEMYKNTTALDNIAVSRAFAVTDYTPMAATGLVTLAVNDRLWLAVMNQTDAVDITIRHINVNISKL